MWWSETHVVSQLAAVGRTVAGAVGRCWEMLGDWRCWFSQFLSKLVSIAEHQILYDMST